MQENRLRLWEKMPRRRLVPRKFSALTYIQMLPFYLRLVSEYIKPGKERLNFCFHTVVHGRGSKNIVLDYMNKSISFLTLGSQSCL